MQTVIFDHQTFAAQEFGGISRYFCELASRVHGLEGFQSKVVAPLHLNAYLQDFTVPQFGFQLKINFPGRGRMCQAVNALIAPPITLMSNPSLIHRTYYEKTPRLNDCPVVLSVFDMIHELFPDNFAPNDLVSHKKRAAVDAADHLICISHSTANDLVRIFDVPRSKISVIYLGYSEVFAQPAPLNELSPHGRPYLLYVGQRNGYKNFGNTLLAYAASRLLRENFDFVVFGGSQLSEEEYRLIESLSLRQGSVVRLGGSDEELARAYRHARMFVYPSKYEGFGIPPLEAMSSGCVVASSIASSLPEVVGDAAISFEPSDIDEIRFALERGCFDENVRQQLLTAGRHRVKEFTWERCARETVAVYKKVIGT